MKTQLAPYKYPRWIEFIDELPKTATGKIQRFKLRAARGMNAIVSGARTRTFRNERTTEEELSMKQPSNDRSAVAALRDCGDASLPPPALLAVDARRVRSSRRRSRSG